MYLCNIFYLHLPGQGSLENIIQYYNEIIGTYQTFENPKAKALETLGGRIFFPLRNKVTPAADTEEKITATFQFQAGLKLLFSTLSMLVMITHSKAFCHIFAIVPYSLKFWIIEPQDSFDFFQFLKHLKNF